MVAHTDIYAIADDRSVASINAFLDEFLPERIDLQFEDWTVRDYPWGPVKAFTDTDEVLVFCCENKHVTKFLLWGDARDHMNVLAMVNFLIDGHVILGVAVPSEHESHIRAVSERLAGFVSDPRVIVGLEVIPPDSVSQQTAKKFAKYYDSLPESDDGSTVRTHDGFLFEA